MSIDPDPATRNQNAYAKDSVASRYSALTTLFPGEEILIQNYRSAFSGKVLDVGVGAGRTTEVLSKLAASYLGIDLSPAMIAAAKERLPNVNLQQMDMRSIPDLLADQKFDLIFISFNSIDYISYGERQTLLHLLSRMLTESGLLIFSTHSLDHLQHKPVRLRPSRSERPQPHILFSNPGEFLKQCYRLGRWLLKAPLNRLRFRGLQRWEDGVALVNDRAEYFSLLTTYTSEKAQVEHLEKIGMTVLDRIGGDRAAEDAFFHYYVCSRPDQGKSAS